MMTVSSFQDFIECVTVFYLTLISSENTRLENGFLALRIFSQLYIEF